MIATHPDSILGQLASRPLRPAPLGQLASRPLHSTPLGQLASRPLHSTPLGQRASRPLWLRLTRKAAILAATPETSIPGSIVHCHEHSRMADGENVAARPFCVMRMGRCVSRTRVMYAERLLRHSENGTMSALERVEKTIQEKENEGGVIVMLNIIDEYNLYVECDNNIADEYDVKIELPSYPLRPAILFNNKNGNPVLAKEFIQRVKRCKESGKLLSIDWKMDKKPKAWISKGNCASTIGNINNAHCTIDALNKLVTIRCCDNNSGGLFKTM